MIPGGIFRRDITEIKRGSRRVSAIVRSPIPVILNTNVRLL